MDPILLIILIVVALVVVGGAGLALLRGRSVQELPPSDAPSVDATPGAVDTIERLPVEEPVVEKPASFRDRLGKARSTMSGYLSSIIGRGDVNAETWEELEEALIRADVGVSATMDILEEVRATVEADGVADGAALVEMVKAEMKNRLGGQDLDLALGGDPSVWLFVGVNGVGKTTTIGKIATREVAAGRNLVLAAGDTFRAAAAEQLTMWGDRSGAHVVRGTEGGDPSSVIFDAVEHAAANGADVVLADTAGRLQNKTNLMNELSKVRRVAEKGAGTVTETLLVIDATTGQNGLVQAREFMNAADVTGVVLTKLDGSAKGGIVVAVQTELGIPVKLVGLGEGAQDLIPFDASDFVDALFD
ncbi:MAG: signal recognition particle-docking protein FtsY [Acidimicrobiales bacterium]